MLYMAGQAVKDPGAAPQEKTPARGRGPSVGDASEWSRWLASQCRLLLVPLLRHPLPAGDLGHPALILAPRERCPEVRGRLVQLQRLRVPPHLDPHEPIGPIHRL